MIETNRFSFDDPLISDSRSIWLLQKKFWTNFGRHSISRWFHSLFVYYFIISHFVVSLKCKQKKNSSFTKKSCRILIFDWFLQFVWTKLKKILLFVSLICCSSYRLESTGDLGYWRFTRHSFIGPKITIDENREK